MKEKDKTDAPVPVKDEKLDVTSPFELNATPFFVEAEKMFEEFAQLSNATAQRAFDFFRARGGEFGREIDDWFNAESELLRFVPVEVREQNGTLNVTAAIAGFKPSEVEISVKDNTLMISGKTEARDEKKEENLVYSDFRSNRFFRQIPLPETVKVDEATAEIKDGLLHISLPKAKTAEVAKIAVTGA